jgi:HK97 family phage major capsid protein
MDLNIKMQERAKLVKDARDLLERENFNQEDETQFNKMMDDADKIKAEVERAKRVQETEKELNTYEKPKLAAKFDGMKKDEIRASKEYKNAFETWVRSPNTADTSFKNALSTAPDTAGGFLVPEDWEMSILKQMEYGNPMQMLTRRISTTSLLNIPIETSRASAAWTAENASYNEDDAVFGNITLSAHKLTVLTRVSEELLQDSFINIPSYLTESFGIELGKVVEQSLISGTGTGQPTGGMTGATAVAGTAGAIADTELFDLYYSLKPGYRGMSSWVMHTEIIKAIRMLKDANGQYLYITSGVADIPDTILGRPVYESEYMDSTVGAGDEPILFGDMMQYTVADRRPFNIKVLNELYATNGQTGYQAMLRIDGRTIMGEGISKLVLA